MDVVSPLTNDVSGNIDIAVKELKAGVSPALAIRGLVFRDVRAMLNGGPEQAQHFRLGPQVYDGCPRPWKQPITSPDRDALEEDGA